MKNKLNRIAKDTNNFLNNFVKKQKKTDLIAPIKYSIFPSMVLLYETLGDLTLYLKQFFFFLFFLKNEGT